MQSRVRLKNWSMGMTMVGARLAALALSADQRRPEDL
jgi:hypothetical protein